MSTELKTLNGYGFDATKLGGLDAQYYAQGRAAHNLLDNSDFTNPVNQRGKTSYSAAGYTIDRWDIARWSSDGSDTINLSIETNGIRLSGGTDSTSKPNSCYILQKLDASKMLGKTYTIAVNVTSLSGDGKGRIHVGYDSTYFANALLKTGINIITFTMPSSASTFFMTIGNYASGAGTGTINVLMEWAALYEGSYTADTLPAYQPKGYAAELAECRRYYQTIPALTHIPGVTNTSVSFGAKYKIPTMRIAPTVSIASGQEVSIYTGEYSASTTNYTMQYATMPNQMILNLSLGAGSFVAYKPGMLTFPVEIALSADL